MSLLDLSVVVYRLDLDTTCTGDLPILPFDCLSTAFRGGGDQRSGEQISNLGEPPNLVRAGTFVGSVALLLDRAIVTVDIDEAGNMDMKTDGEEVDLGQPVKMRFSNSGSLSYEPFNPNYGQTASVQTNLFNITVVAVKAYSNAQGKHTRGHLDIYATLKSRPGPMGGVLAANFAALANSNLVLDEGQALPGAEAEFAVSSMASRVFQKLLRLPISISRHQLSRAAADRNNAYPVHARVTA